MTVSLPRIAEIVKALENCYSSLTFHKIDFPEGIKKETWRKQSEHIVKNVLKEINIQDNIYFIFGENQELLDIGKASSKNKDIRNRLKAHLIYCSERTSSKLKNIQDYIVDGNHKTVIVSSLRIEPEEYYQMAESFFIMKYKPKWNFRVD